MKKIILLFFAIAAFGFTSVDATVENIKKLRNQNITIVDIRTPPEWEATGVIPGALRDTFFLRDGSINRDFLQTLKKNGVKKFAIICRTGHRSAVAAEILEKNGIEVINLKGGMFRLMKDMLKREF
ncbi:rhodanese-like domain-containing protein [Caminibacter pacificus]|uniref:Rhodanese-like domain-containing protein n=1 Tax=Caminibacter pacificus TaxID=1424653 RepID=A0AAJ4RBS9_9BACT|nr:rhodanese-like domain-containing protein [Caminibacter pacificus]QCI29120.1 rhodanese-like domain-containing protein [Caminibacter pacificus]ROR39061.1 rhodanese-related sulfurtransferase [Caminibacter pacificus]